MGGLDATEWTAVTAIATAAYTAVTAILVYVAWKQLEGLKAQAKASQASADAHIDALQKQIAATEAARMDGMRPLITLGSLTVSVDGMLQLKVKNIGPGPGRHVIVWVGYWLRTGPRTEPTTEGPTRAVKRLREDPVLLRVGDIGAGEEKNYPAQVEAMFAGHDLAIAARFAYEDVYGRSMADPLPHDQPHYITMARREPA